MKNYPEIIADINQELQYQDRKWGTDRNLKNFFIHRMNYPIGTSSYAKRFCEREKTDFGEYSWLGILTEECAEVADEVENDEKLRTELVQLAAVCIQWIDNIDRRKSENSKAG